MNADLDMMLKFASSKEYETSNFKFHRDTKDYNTSYGFFFHPEVVQVHYIFIVLTLCFVPFIVLNNTLVIASVAFSPLIRKIPHNWLFLSLAIADLSMGIHCIPMYTLAYLVSTQQYVFHNKFLCLDWFSSVQMAAGGSLINLLVISIDRYVAILWPFFYQRHINGRRMRKIVALVWAYIILNSYLPMLGWNTFRPGLCNYYSTLPLAYLVWANFFTVGLSIGIPFILYAQIIVIVWRQATAMSRYSHLFDTATKRKFRREVTSVKITSMLVFLFIFLWLPYGLVLFIKYSDIYKMSKVKFEQLKVLCQVSYFFNAMVNAPVYAVGKNVYWVAMKIILTSPPWEWKQRLSQANRERSYKEAGATNTGNTTQTELPNTE